MRFWGILQVVVQSTPGILKLAKVNILTKILQEIQNLSVVSKGGRTKT